jgi:uncharacterized membrane protein
MAAWIGALFAWLVTTAAFARSGGSIGGGFHAPAPRAPVGGGSHSWGGGSHSWGGGGGFFFVGGNGTVFTILFLIFIAVLVSRVIAAARQQKQAEAASRLDVACYELGIHAVARSMQDRLEALADRVDTSNQRGLHAMLREVVLELRRQKLHVRFAGAEVHRGLTGSAAEQRFQALAGDARSKYDREVIRADDVGVRRQQKEVATDGYHDEDGQLAVKEFFVVTLVVAARNTKFPDKINDGPLLDQALTALGSIALDDLAAAEVIWSPASKSDAMNRDDIDERYPRLLPV